MDEIPLPKEFIEIHEAICKKVWPVLRAELGGKPIVVQGSVLADFMAIWISGHVIAGDRKATIEAHEALLRMQMDQIAKFVEFYRGTPAEYPSHGKARKKEEK